MWSCRAAPSGVLTASKSGQSRTFPGPGLIRAALTRIASRATARGKASKDKVGGSRTYHLLQRRYGITAEDADRMFAAQDGLCAICCERPPNTSTTTTPPGWCAGLLCFNCNGGLRQFRDDGVLLDSAGSYLDSHLPARTDVAVLARLARALNDCPGTTPAQEAARAVLLSVAGAH